MLTIKYKLFVLPMILAIVFSFTAITTNALTYDEIVQSTKGKILGDNTSYPYVALVSNASLKLGVTPLDFQNGHWDYNVTWNRTLNRQGSVMLRKGISRVNGQALAEPAAQTVSAHSGYVLDPGGRYNVEFWSKPGSTGVLLARKYFTTLKAPVASLLPPTPTLSLIPTPSTTPVPTPTPTITPSPVLGLSASQSDIIKKDLQAIKSLGFKRIRIITYVRYSSDSFYTTWPSNVFITFPKPKDSELANLKQYLQLVDQAGLQYEFVLLMPDSKNKYYTNNITGQDYKNFVDAIWPTMWTGKLDSILVGGDMSLNPPTIDTQNPDIFPVGKNVVDSHRQWLLEMWPYMNAKCPGCNIGVELLTGYAKFWDAGASNLSWIKSNLNPQPKFVGVQYYPTTPTALTNLGFKQGSVINWDAAVKDWYENLKTAAGGIPILADEVGLDLNLGFTQQDQADFYKATTAYLVQNGIHFNVWEFADHPGIGLLGLMDVNRILKPSATAVQNVLTPTLPTAFTAGIQYTPPESVGWQFMMPQN